MPHPFQHSPPRDPSADSADPHSLDLHADSVEIPVFSIQGPTTPVPDSSASASAPVAGNSALRLPTPSATAAPTQSATLAPTQTAAATHLVAAAPFSIKPTAPEQLGRSQADVRYGAQPAAPAALDVPSWPVTDGPSVTDSAAARPHTTPELAVVQPELAVVQPELAVEQPELAVEQPELAVEQPELAAIDPLQAAEAVRHGPSADRLHDAVAASETFLPWPGLGSHSAGFEALLTAIREAAGPDQPLPPAPRSLRDCGIGPGMLSDLLLKHLFLAGELTVDRAAHELRLPAGVVHELIQCLELDSLCEVSAGEVSADTPDGDAATGPSQTHLRLRPSTAGRARAREAFASSSYVGPAPVSFADFQRMTMPLGLRSEQLRISDFEQEFSDLVLVDDVREKIGAAAWTGRHTLLLGASGNGKTSLATKLSNWLRKHADDVLVPYAVFIEGTIVTVFDPGRHVTALGSYQADTALPADGRWVRVRPPALTVSSRDLDDLWKVRAGRGFAAAPLAVLANGGVIQVDEPAGPNHWSDSSQLSAVLEGQQFRGKLGEAAIRWPCTATFLLTGSTAPPEANLRRIPHLVDLPAPTRSAFAEILRRECFRRGIAFSDDVVSRVFADPESRSIPPRASDPGELLENVAALCRFSQVPAQLTPVVWERALEMRGVPSRRSA